MDRTMSITMYANQNRQDQALARAAKAKATRPALPKPARASTLEGWQTAPILKQIVTDPTRVANGTLGLSPFRSKIRLLVWS